MKFPIKASFKRSKIILATGFDFKRKHVLTEDEYGWNDKFLVANQSIVAMRNKYNIPVNIRLTEITTDISFVSWTFLIQDKFTRSQFLKKSDEKRFDPKRSTKKRKRKKFFGKQVQRGRRVEKSKR